MSAQRRMDDTHGRDRPRAYGEAPPAGAARSRVRTNVALAAAGVLTVAILALVALAIVGGEDTLVSALGAGIAGGADVILIPEIPYDAEAVAEAIRQRSRTGSRFSIVAVSEGSMSRQQAANLQEAQAIVDRTKENLSSSDVAVAQTRRLLLDTLAAYEAGELPPGSARTPGGVRIPQPFDAVLDAGQSWSELQPTG